LIRGFGNAVELHLVRTRAEREIPFDLREESDEWEKIHFKGARGKSSDTERNALFLLSVRGDVSGQALADETREASNFRSTQGDKLAADLLSEVSFFLGRSRHKRDELTVISLSK
jgi:hypothetical protein